MRLASFLGKVINAFLSPLHLQIVRVPRERKSVKAYIPFEETLRAAEERNLSIADYLEMLWGIKKHREGILSRMEAYGLFDQPLRSICEIGTGTGMYAAAVIQKCEPITYESYEPDPDWSDYLARTYPIICHKTDGRTLQHTPTSSVDLVVAHGVFVYLALLTSMSYFRELVRVTKQGAYAVFDIISEDCLDDETLDRWLQSGDLSPCLLSKEYVVTFFVRNGFALIGDFIYKFHISMKCHYLVFKKRGYDSRDSAATLAN